jgi:hypothetical protein
MTEDAGTGQRIFVRDTVPYAVPESLEELQGPDHGIVELPVSVHWGPKSTFRVDSPEALAHYAYVLNAGTIDDLRTILNRTVLEQSWAALLLPARCRRLWEAKFPQLAA